MSSRPFIEVINDITFFTPFFGGLLLQPLLYYSTIKTFPKIFLYSKKSRAWILTLFSSAIMTIGSIPFLTSFVINNRNFVWFGMADGHYPISLSAFFMSYLISDLLIGYYEYPMHINVWSGWFHHSLYTVLVFCFIQWRVCGIFCTVGILEAPTLILALGAVNKNLRQDKLFGAVFFLTRILLHVYFALRLWKSYPNELYHWITMGIFPLHAMWFKGWINQQIRIHQTRIIEKNELLKEQEEEEELKKQNQKEKTSMKYIPSSKRNLVSAINASNTQKRHKKYNSTGGMNRIEPIAA